MTAWLLQMLLSTAALMALVLLVRRPIGQAFGAKAAYALWLAPALRAVMPPLPAAPVTLGSTPAAATTYFMTVGDASASTVWPSASILVGIWLLGAIAMLGYHCLRHRRFIVRALAEGHALHIAGVDQEVIASTAVAGPMATGLIHPMIFVSHDFADRFTVEEQRFALLHEKLHHRRGDIWASAAALLVASAHWFNPLAHVALGAFRRDMESACDASVLDLLGGDAAPNYARTILRCAAPPAPRSLCALTSIDELKGRLKMLKINHGRARRLAGIFLAGAVAVGGIATAGSAQDKDQKRTIEKRIVIHDVNGDAKGLEERSGGHAHMKCPGEKFEATSSSGSAGKKQEVKLVLCAGKGESLLATLQKAEGDIAKSDDMLSDRKDDVLRQIRSKIAELRAKG